MNNKINHLIMISLLLCINGQIIGMFSDTGHSRGQNTAQETLESALFDALDANDSDTAMALIGDPRLNVNAQDRNGLSVLHKIVTPDTYETISNMIPLIEALLRAGANIDIQDNNGNTPLARAIQCRNFQATRYLIEQGADVNATNNDGQTILKTAILTNMPIFVTFLIDCGRLRHNMIYNEDQILNNQAVLSDPQRRIKQLLMNYLLNS